MTMREDLERILALQKEYLALEEIRSLLCAADRAPDPDYDRKAAEAGQELDRAREAFIARWEALR